jgi:hypothetical protein
MLSWATFETAKHPTPLSGMMPSSQEMVLCKCPLPPIWTSFLQQILPLN